MTVVTGGNGDDRLIPSRLSPAGCVVLWLSTPLQGHTARCLLHHVYSGDNAAEKERDDYQCNQRETTTVDSPADTLDIN
ncbi:hypothetical protein V3C99_015070 [Haemonchus contortus]